MKIPPVFYFFSRDNVNVSLLLFTDCISCDPVIGTVTCYILLDVIFNYFIKILMYYFPYFEDLDRVLIHG